MIFCPLLIDCLGRRAGSGNRLVCRLFVEPLLSHFPRLVSCLVSRLICRHFNCLARCLTLICVVDLHMNSHHEVDYDGQHDDDDVSLRCCCCCCRQRAGICKVVNWNLWCPLCSWPTPACLLLHSLIVLAALRIRCVCVP